MEKLIREVPVALMSIIALVVMTSTAAKEVRAQTEKYTEEQAETESIKSTLPVAGIAATIADLYEESPKEPEKEPETEPQEPEPERIKPDRDNPDHYILAKLAMAEAEGESTDGKALVITVVYNRIKDPNFPDTVVEVVNQPGAFSCISGRRYDKVEPNEDCWTALENVLNGWDESKGALFFERSDAKGTWQQRNRPYLFTEGNHSFYE